MSMIPYGEPGQWGKNASDNTTFSKIVLPLTDSQTEAATRLYMAGYDTMPRNMQRIMIDACRDWQRCIQEVASK